jgi:hypothetical protein
LRNNGIVVIYDVRGEADEAVNRYLAGQLRPRAFCERRGRNACRRRRGSPWDFFPASYTQRIDLEKKRESKK